MEIVFSAEFYQLPLLIAEVYTVFKTIVELCMDAVGLYPLSVKVHTIHVVIASCFLYTDSAIRPTIT